MYGKRRISLSPHDCAVNQFHMDAVLEDGGEELNFQAVRKPILQDTVRGLSPCISTGQQGCRGLTDHVLVPFEGGDHEYRERWSVIEEWVIEERVRRCCAEEIMVGFRP